MVDGDGGALRLFDRGDRGLLGDFEGRRNLRDDPVDLEGGLDHLRVLQEVGASPRLASLQVRLSNWVEARDWMGHGSGVQGHRAV